ncbi:MAG TPA: saccharopine dehydrogenase NADP-binding domain-containing protein [Verrucomicrobiae bacterium]|nr:saccharopine dehydrogenase NADP-binding domain-containing protein [Verrucomicrobiae bacterium]
MTTGNNRKFVVLGGVGTIGRVVVRDLFESDPHNRITIADYNAPGARKYAQSFRSRRVRGAFADASQPAQLAKLFRGHSVVINCTQHDFNLRVMRAALRAHVHYLDLGGLFYWTRRQLKLNGQFTRAGLTAILGMGCAPGITNVLTRAAADMLERVDSVRIRVGTKDLNPPIKTFYFPYSAQTIIEEFTLPPWVFERGRFRPVAPRTAWEQVNFPRPVGKQWLVRTRHSEVATIPLTFRGKGVKFCDFKVGFDRPFVREVVKRLKAGWTVRELARLPAPHRKPNDYEIARVTATGRSRKRNGVPTTIVVDCHAKANRRWGVGAGDVDTGCPPSIVAQMIVTGTITQRGVRAPEVVVPVGLFFAELRKRGMKVKLERRARR